MRTYVPHFLDYETHPLLLIASGGRGMFEEVFARLREDRGPLYRAWKQLHLLKLFKIDICVKTSSFWFKVILCFYAINGII